MVSRVESSNVKARLVFSGGYKGGYWGYLPPPRILGVNTPPLESWG